MEALTEIAGKAITHRFAQVFLSCPAQSNINNAYVNKAPAIPLYYNDTGFYIVAAETNLVNLYGPCNSFNGKLK